MANVIGGRLADPWEAALTPPVSREEWLRRIHAALEVTNGRRELAARLLHISPRTVRRLLGPKPGIWYTRSGARITIPEPGA